MLAIPAPTDIDLKFRLFRVPVRVHPLFWLAMALIGWQGREVRFTLVFIACGFISIMVHEFGHALMSRVFGCRPSVVLYGLGGLCASEAERQKPWQRFLVIAAGPGAGLLFFGLIFAGLAATKRSSLSMLGEFALQQLLFINLVWSLLNLLPIWPLDGGQLTGVVTTAISRPRGMQWTHILSMIVAGGLAFFCFQRQMVIQAIFLGYFALINFQQLQLQRFRISPGSYDDDADWWKK